MKLLVFTLTLLLAYSFKTQAQTQQHDSLTMVNQANADARKFKLNKADLKKFRKHRGDYMYQYTPAGNQFSGPPNIIRPPLGFAGLHKAKDGYRRIDYTSDYFKPSSATTKDTTLLQDSVYVKTFRNAAYQRTTNRRTAWHYIGISAAISAGIFLTVVIISLSNGLSW